MRHWITSFRSLMGAPNMEPAGESRKAEGRTFVDGL
jgi:hypothetical protein